jgi:hypothetical protein
MVLNCDFRLPSEQVSEGTPRRNIATAAFAFALGLAGARAGEAQTKQQNQTANKTSDSVPEIVVTAPKSKAAGKPQRRTTTAAAAAPAQKPATTS